MLNDLTEAMKALEGKKLMVLSDNVVFIEPLACKN